jgi:hypothetical protein
MEEIQSENLEQPPKSITDKARVFKNLLLIPVTMFVVAPIIAAVFYGIGTISRTFSNIMEIPFAVFLFSWYLTCFVSIVTFIILILPKNRPTIKYSLLYIAIVVLVGSGSCFANLLLLG